MSSAPRSSTPVWAAPHPAEPIKAVLARATRRKGRICRTAGTPAPRVALSGGAAIPSAKAA